MCTHFWEGSIINFFSQIPVWGWVVIGVAGIILFFSIWRIFFPVSWFINKLAYSGPDGRRAATEVLCRLGNRKAVKPLIMALKDESPDARRSAAKALDDLHWKPQTQEEKMSYLIAKQNWQALIQIGPLTVEPLILALKDKNPEVSRSAAETLEIVGKDITEREVIEKYLEIRADSKWSSLTLGVDKVENSFNSFLDSVIRPLKPIGNTLEEAAVALDLIFDRIKLDRKRKVITVNYSQAITLVNNPTKVRRLIDGKLERKREVKPEEPKVLTELKQSLKQLQENHQKGKKAGREITVKTLEDAIQAKKVQIKEVEEKLKRIPTLEAALKEMEKSVANLKEEIVQLEAQLKQSQTERDTLTQQLSQQEPAYNQIESEVKELDEDYQRAKQEKRTITAQTLEPALREKQKMLEERKPQLDALRDNLIQAQQQIERITTQLQAKQQELQNTPKAYAELQEELNRLKEEIKSNLNKPHAPNAEKPKSTSLKFIFPFALPRMSDSFLNEEVLQVVATEFVTQEGLKLFGLFNKSMF